MYSRPQPADLHHSRVTRPGFDTVAIILFFSDVLDAGRVASGDRKGSEWQSAWNSICRNRQISLPETRLEASLAERFAQAPRSLSPSAGRPTPTTSATALLECAESVLRRARDTGRKAPSPTPWPQRARNRRSERHLQCRSSSSRYSPRPIISISSSRRFSIMSSSGGGRKVPSTLYSAHRANSITVGARARPASVSS